MGDPTMDALDAQRDLFFDVVKLTLGFVLEAARRRNMEVVSNYLRDFNLIGALERYFWEVAFEQYIVEMRRTI